MHPSRMIFGTALIVLPSLWAAGTAHVVRADVLELTNGGRVEGRLAASQESEEAVVIETSAGARLTVPRSQIKRIDSTSEPEAQYDSLARTSPDTVEAHWKLAEWCRDKGLRDEADRHLARILELDPDHAEARRLLGYREANGQWMTRDEVMASRGMVLYEGRYVTRQHVELLERAKETRESEAEWSDRLERLRRRLVGRREDRAAQARQEILSIREPLAAEAIVEMLRREKDPVVRELWIRAAAQVDHPTTLDALVRLSLYDPDDETRRQCLEYVIQTDRPGIATPYIRALKSHENEIVNRAAAALGEIGDADAIGPLIDALLTKHTVRLGDGNADQYAITFSPSGGSGYSFGGGAKTATHWIRNPAVLGALVSLCGTSFDYDQEQWRTWLAAQAKLHRVDVRRDP